MNSGGRRFYKHVLPLFQDRQERMLSVLSPAERRTFDRPLTALVDRDDDPR